ncbi:hypothetical protein BH11BAC4_BH11BAC4_04670 [soil metagenome]
MKKSLFLFLAGSFALHAYCQEKEKSTKEKVLEELAENSCKCIDSISVYNKSKEQVAKDVNRCIDEQAVAYQMASKMSNIDELAKAAVENDGKKEIRIAIDMDKNSNEYKEYYYDMERYLMFNCKAVKAKIATDEKQSARSMSKDPDALSFYSRGVEQTDRENFKDALPFFEKAVKIDPGFAFAWDNLGVCYRKLGDYDKALDAYKRSLEIDPKGMLPLQNIAIVYQFKKEYREAIRTYERLAEIDPKNPEIYYGIGHVYTAYLNEYEKGLDNMCKAYNLYVELKSPYRTDAEKVMQLIYAEMKKQGKEERFNEILKEYNITPK